jgi:UDP-N-acetylmuramoyl-tripeptide--D-alanyl-D-alanine ligase
MSFTRGEIGMRVKLSIPLALREIEGVISPIKRNVNRMVEYITTDSREAESGDLFFALDGDITSGEEYVSDALSRGAIPVTKSTLFPGIHVKDTRDALLSLSHYYLTRLTSLKERICITGSVGKTTTKELLKHILSYERIVHATKENYNNEIGVPLTIFSCPADAEAIIVEMGTNHIGEIRRLSQAVCPTLSIITNIGSSHIGNFGSREMIAKEKSDIICGMKTIRLITEFKETLLDFIRERKTFSCQSSEADFFLNPIEEDITGTTFNFTSVLGVMSGVKFNIAGRHILSSLGMAISASLTAGASIESIRNAVSSIPEDCVRHKLIKMDGYTILDDSYNASLESVIADLRMLSLYKNHLCSALIGDILELGNKTEEIHREIGTVAYKTGIRRLYLYGVYSGFIAEGAISAGMQKKNIFINTDIQSPDKTAYDIIKNHSENEIILFKASHKLNLGRIVDILKTFGKE